MLEATDQKYGTININREPLAAWSIVCFLNRWMLVANASSFDCLIDEAWFWNPWKSVEANFVCTFRYDLQVKATALPQSWQINEALEALADQKRTSCNMELLQMQTGSHFLLLDFTGGDVVMDYATWCDLMRSAYRKCNFRNSPTLIQTIAQDCIETYWNYRGTDDIPRWYPRGLWNPILHLDSQLTWQKGGWSLFAACQCLCANFNHTPLIFGPKLPIPCSFTRSNHG